MLTPAFPRKEAAVAAAAGSWEGEAGRCGISYREADNRQMKFLLPVFFFVLSLSLCLSAG